MHIAIFSSSAADIALIARSLPAHDCQGVQQRADLRRAHPHLLIVDIASAGAHLTEILQMAKTPAIPLLLLATDAPSDLAALAALAASPTRPAAEQLIDNEFKPLRRNALAARVKLLLQQAYPDHDEKHVQQFGDYVFESPAHIVSHSGGTATLTQKEFSLAVLLFSNLGRPLSRAYLQETVWGPEDDNELPTRTIDTHISRVRNKLELKPEKGFRLTTVYGYGYQLERLAAPVTRK